jgi:hypothetical protein
MANIKTSCCSEMFLEGCGAKAGKTTGLIGDWHCDPVIYRKPRGSVEALKGEFLGEPWKGLVVDNNVLDWTISRIEYDFTTRMH